MPAGAPDPAKIDAEAVYAEFLQRIADGDPQNFSELCNRHPQLAGQLLDLHERNETISMPQQALTDAHGAGAADFTVVNAQGTPPRYGILERLAQGGMGVIYKAWDGRLRRELAMKLIRDKKNRDSHTPATSVSPESLARFVREAEITARLDHPGVVPIHDMGTDEQGRAFFTRRLVQGQRLDIVFDLARQQVKRWSQTRVLDVIVKICETVAFAHSRGVIHRDLKPSNIMVGRFGETYVMDWGLAKNLRDAKARPQADDQAEAETVIYEEGSSSPHLGTSDLLQLPDSDMETKAGAVLGTAAYMPPEQAAGQISLLDERSDIYSVGAILYELLSGRRPYAVPGQPVGRSRDIISAVIAGPPTAIVAVNPRVSAELVAICEKAMERRKEDRYQSMTEMAEDLRAYLENRVVRAHQTGAVAELRKWVARNRWTAVASATGLVVALALLLTVVGVQSAANTSLFSKNQEISNANVQILRETALKEQALIEQTRAREQADSELARAEGLILARASADVVSTNPGQALLLALESAKRQPGDAANTAILAALAAHHEVHVLRGHRGPVRIALASPDGATLVTASDDHTAILWDIAAGEPRAWLLGHSNGVHTAAFSADGGQVATAGSLDRSVRIWNARSGELSAVLKGHEHSIERVAFNPRGDRLITCSLDGTARVWVTATGESLFEIAAHAAPVYTAEFSPDGDRIVTAGADKTARVWSADSGTELFSLDEHEGKVGFAGFSADGKLVLTTTNRPTADRPAGETNFAFARVCDAATGKLRTLLPHPALIEAAAFSHDALHVLTGCSDGAICLWDAATGSLERKWDARGQAVKCIAFSPDDRFLAAGTKSGTIWLCDRAVPTATPLLGHSDAVTSVSFPSPTLLATASLDQTARIWTVRSSGTVAPVASDIYQGADIAINADATRLLMRPRPSSTAVLSSFPDGDRIAVLEHPSRIRSAHFSPQGTLVATLTETGEVHLFSTVDGQRQKTLEGTGDAWQAVFDGESRLIVAPLTDGAVTVWNLHDWSLERTQEFPGRKLLRVSPDGKRLAAWAGDSRDFELFPTSSAERIAAFPVIANPASEIPIIAFAPDGQTLATWSVQGAPLKLWDPVKGQLISTHGPRSGNIRFSPDGKLIGTRSADSAAEIRDAATGRLVTRLAGHETSITDIYISPAGARVVTLSADSLSRLWNGATGKSLGLLTDRDDFIQRASFSRDGQRLLTISGKGSKVTLWNSDNGDRQAQISSGTSRFSMGIFSDDGRWIVTSCIDGSTRTWPTDPVTYVKTRTLRQLSPEERDLFDLGTAQEQSDYRRSAVAQSLTTYLVLAGRNSLRFNQAAAIRAACEPRLREFVQSGEFPDSTSRAKALSAIEEQVRRQGELSAPVSAAFARVKADLDAASRGE